MQSAPRRATGLLVAGFAIAGLALFGAGRADADGINFGSQLNRAYDGASICGTTGCVGTQHTITAGTDLIPLRSPRAGVITRWRVRSADQNASYAFRLLRPSGGFEYTAVSTAPAPTPVPAATDAIHTYTASLPVQAGDAAGVMVGLGADGLPLGNSSGLGPENQVGYDDAIANGETDPFSTAGPSHLLLQATVTFCRVPAVTGLRSRRAVALIRRHDCRPKVIRKATRRRARAGRVLRQKVPAGATGMPGKVVPIVVGRLRRRAG